jgi:Uma2 family endonuclease
MVTAIAPPQAATQTTHLVVRFRPLFEMTPDEFYDFCALNPDLNVELTAEGEVVFMSPSGAATGARNARLILALGRWSNENGTGVFFDSSAGFTLPNKAVRAPDASWVRRERLADLTPQQRERFLPLCPDFVVEIASPTDRIAVLQAKMDEYMANGAQLGWLLDPTTRTVYVYRPGEAVATLESAPAVSGDPVLPGFSLELGPVWEPGLE